MGETWIGVTGFYATDNPHPGLAVVRALRQADPSWRILALTWDRFSTGAYAEGLIDAHALIPYPAAGPRALLKRLDTVVATHPLDVVIPTVDAELAHWGAMRPALRRLGVASCLPTMAALRAREKRRLPALGRRAGFAVPETLVLSSPDAVTKAAGRRRYPQIVKGTLVDSTVVHTPEDFRVAGWQLAEEWGYPVLAQPLIGGEEYDVAGVARRGELLEAAVMKKLAVTNKGTAWAGVTVEEPHFVALLRRIVAALRWDGGIEAEFIAATDGGIYCFEINPRLPSWIALASEAGANLPAALVRLAMGEDVEPALAQPGRLLARTLIEHTYAGNPLAALTGGAARRNLLSRALASPTTPVAGRAGTVAITGLNAADNPSAGLTVARCLRALSPAPRLIGLTHEVLATGVYVDRAWDEVRLLPFPSREDGGYPEALLEQCRDAGVDCLLPTIDVEVPIVTWLADHLAAAGVATLVPPAAALAAAAKPRLPGIVARGFRVPRTRLIATWAELETAIEEMGRPFMLKGPVADAKPVRTAEEAHVVARRLAASWGFPLLAQEWIAGEEYGVAAVADRAHRIVGTVVVRKEIRSANGNTWGGTTVVDRTLEKLAATFAEALGWVGPFELEVIRHPRRGPFVIEANPRFPAWVYLSAGAGANLPWAAVRLARGERVNSLRPRPGTFYVRQAWDAIASVERMGALSVEGRVDGHVI
jgi:carbamoyl-phosphate synthase large subunit